MRIAVLSATLVATTLLVGCNDNASETQTPAEAVAPKPSMTVESVTPSSHMWKRSMSASGDITAWELASAGPEEMGMTIDRVLVREGEYVKKGQVLARFSATTIHAQAAQAKAGLAEAKAAAADAQANAKRMKKLVDSGFMSAVQYNQYQTAAETAQARVAAAQAVVRQQNIRLKNSTLRAPVSGVIAQSNAIAGALTSAGQSLFTIIRNNRLEWRAQVTAAELSQLVKGTEANITLPDGTQVTGTVRQTGAMVDPRTRNATVYVDLPTDSAAKMGMYASGAFILGERQVLTLPQTAIVFRDGFSNVVLIQDDNSVRIKRVETSGNEGDLVAISSGIEPNQRYVRQGGAFLNTGDYVRITDSMPVKPAGNLNNDATNEATHNGMATTP